MLVRRNVVAMLLIIAVGSFLGALLLVVFSMWTQFALHAVGVAPPHTVVWHARSGAIQGSCVAACLVVFLPKLRSWEWPPE